MAHGAGGKATHTLVEALFRPAFGNPSGDAALLATVTAGGANTLPTVTNHFDGKRAHRMLRSDATRTAHATAIADLVAARDYDGIDIDYENLRPVDRARFTAFATTLATKLHAQGKLLSLTLM